MNLKNCPLQYLRIINKFLDYFGEDKIFLEPDAKNYIEKLRMTELLSLENQRLHIAALKWFYKNTLGQKLNLKTPYRKRGIQDTVSIDEARSLIETLPQKYALLFHLMYGMGLKIGEVLRLRIKNIDINNGKILLSKGRNLKIPFYLFDDMLNQFKKRQKQYIKDKKEQNCFIKKENGKISADFDQQPFFASRKRTKLKGASVLGRQFIDPSTLHVFIKKAHIQAAINKRISTMTLRHSFIVHQLKKECNQVELSYYLGHTDIRQTLHYMKLFQRVQSGPCQLLQQPERTPFVRELNKLKTYPDSKKLDDLLRLAETRDKSFIAQTADSQTWEKWLKQAKDKGLDILESCDDYETKSADYIFLDLTNLQTSRPLKRIHTISTLLALSHKKLIIRTIPILQEVSRT